MDFATPSEMLLNPQWDAPPNVHSAFTLRGGGVSGAPFDSLNLGAHVGDDPSSVAENRRRVAARLALPAPPLWLNQVHGVDVRDADAGTAVPRSADAVITRRRGVVCAIMVADCIPVLLAARDGSVIGAAHAGWRGLAAGVIDNTVRAMGVPAAQLVAWLGPSIGPAAFEVGEEVRATFLATDSSAAAFRANERGRWLCDLPALARGRLQALGVSAIAGGSWCTLSDSSRFFSHRRDGRSGRMAALLWLAAPA
jgi:YfiH family protein